MSPVIQDSEQDTELKEFRVKLTLFTNPSVNEWVTVKATNAISACREAEKLKEGYLGTESHIIED